MSDTITVLSVGDIILDEPDPSSFLEPATATLTAGDVVIGHVEVPHSTTTASAQHRRPRPAGRPGRAESTTGRRFSHRHPGRQPCLRRRRRRSCRHHRSTPATPDC